MSCPAVASENGTTLVRVRRKNQSNYSSLVLFGVTVKNYTEHGFSALASLIIVGFSPLSVKRIYARARRIHSVSSRSIPGHGGSTQCEADLRPGTVDPLSVKQIYTRARSSRPYPPNGLHVRHGIPAVHHLQRQQQLRASLASAVIDPIKGLGLRRIQ